MSDRITEIETELTGLSGQRYVLSEKIRRLESELDSLKSREFIRVNSITRDDVEMSSGDGKPYFGHVVTFAEWLKKRPSLKRFAEWSGTIYHTTDVLTGRMEPTPGRVEHLPAEEPAQ